MTSSRSASATGQAPLERMLDAKIDTGVPAGEEDFGGIIEQAGLLQ